MGKLSTLDGFTFQEMLDKLSVFAGFVTDLRCWGNTILVTIEDHRGAAEFEGDRSADRLPELLSELSDLGLDTSKALVSLSCRKEPVKAGSPETFNVGVVQLGWAISTPGAPMNRTPEQGTAANGLRPHQPGTCRSARLS